MSLFLALVLRDVRRAYGGGGVTLTIVFFALATILFPFAIGPDARLLAQVGGGVVWTAALLAALLPIERLLAPDLEAGVLDQFEIRGVAPAFAAFAKIVAHWIAFGPPLMAAALLSAGLFALPMNTLIAVETGLLLGTPGLAALAVAVAALVAGLRGGAALAGLLTLPLALPTLIFGAGALTGGPGALQLLAAFSLLLLAGAPFLAGAALRMARS